MKSLDKKPSNQLIYSKYVSFVFLLIVLIFAFIRIININADIPAGITTSGAIYTDEGWYANSAIRHYLTGNWYLPGDINPALLQPGGELIYRFTFATFGMGLASARLTVVFFFLAMILLLALLVRNHFGDLPAILCALLLTTNFFAFAYSRIAFRFLIALFFIVLSTFLIDLKNEKWQLIKIFASSLALTYGILTYTSSAFAIPILMFFALKKGKSWIEKVLYVTIIPVIICSILGIYYRTIITNFPVEFANYNGTITINFVSSFTGWVMNFLHKLYSCVRYIVVDFVGITTLLTASALVVSKRFRTNIFVQLMIGFVLLYIGVLSLSTYDPPRYYLLLLAPLAALFAIGSTSVMDWLFQTKYSRYAYLPPLFVLIVSILGGGKIVSNLLHPEFSFYRMTHDVGSIIQARESRVRGVMLFGDIASSVSLEIGTNAVNNGLWTINEADSRLLEYHPKYLIVHTSDLDKIAASLGAIVTQLGSWNVFNNFYGNGEPVRLYYAAWP